MKKISPRKIERMMRKLGMKFKPIENVSYVEIFTEDGEIIHIERPEVIKMEFSGQIMYQITGGEERLTKREEEIEEIEIPEEDVMIVSKQAGVDRETAKKALIAVNGDLAKAILMLKESQKTKKLGGAGGI